MIGICPRGLEKRWTNDHSSWTTALWPVIRYCVCSAGTLAGRLAVDDEVVRAVGGIIILRNGAEHPFHQVKVVR